MLVTRPAHQTDKLLSLLQSNGFRAVSFPTIEVVGSKVCRAEKHIEKNIAQYDIAIFVSQNAVLHGLKLFKVFPEHIQIAVVGKGSLEALENMGLHAQAIPGATFNSEGLLQCDLLKQVADKKIIIFRGQAGRNLLGDTLSERGAMVDYCEVYRREIPEITESRYARVFAMDYDVAIFTSTQGLEYGLNMLAKTEKQKILAIDWLLISERMTKAAYNCGHQGNIYIASQASDEGIVQSLLEWKKKNSNQ